MAEEIEVPYGFHCPFLSPVIKYGRYFISKCELLGTFSCWLVNRDGEVDMGGNGMGDQRASAPGTGFSVAGRQL